MVQEAYLPVQVALLGRVLMGEAYLNTVQDCMEREASERN